MTAASGTPPADDVLRAAEEAFARVMRGVDEQVERMPPDPEPADALRWAGDRVTELLAGFADLPLARILGVADAPTISGDGTDGARQSAGPGPAKPAGEPIVLSARRGTLAETRVWVHPIGAGRPATLRFSLSGLTGPDAASWSGADADFVPAEIAVPAPVGASTVLRIPVPPDAAIGEHHGLVIGHGVAGAVVPITVVIT